MSDVSPKKSLGQYFLKNPAIVAKIVAAARLHTGDTVLEIGPGTGALTEGLLAAGTAVIALEADERAVSHLRERFAPALQDGTLVLHHTDVRDTPLTAHIPDTQPYQVVANIPYYLSGMLIRAALTAVHQPSVVVFLIQKEVAQRIARSTKESLLSLSVKAYGTPRYVATVSRGNFSPSPAVDSAILAIEDISRSRFTSLDEMLFFRVLHAGFSSRRKQLLGNLTTLYPKTHLQQTFATLHIPTKIRGEDLSIDDWCTLVSALGPTDI